MAEIDVDRQLLETVVGIAVEAGRVILRHYGEETPIDYKADHSPLTVADRASHASIVAALRRVTPDVPVLSEESPAEEVARRREWSRFWLVDPLDGTKEFVKETGEFTVNVAYVSGSEPLLGVVHAPVSGVTYTGIAGTGAWRLSPGEEPVPIHVRRADVGRLTVVASRDHAGPLVDAFLGRISGARTTSMGSSLKFCLVAEGTADFYPRLLPTMEWDTGAAQCVVEAAGGSVTNLQGNRLVYNKADLRNSSFIAYGDGAVDWIEYLAG